MPENTFKSGILKVEIPLNDDIDLKMVTGIEDGRNYQWILLGYTSKNVPGVISDIIPLN